jgi:DNA repair protein RecO (recombination protein O)
MARGALRPKSQFSGVLEPFAEGTATFYMKPNRDLHSLSGFELERERQALGKDLRRYAGASVLCELVLRLAPAERDPLLYDALTVGLDRLVETDSVGVPGVSLAAIWQLVTALGFGPGLDACSRCGNPIADEPAALDLREGFLVCSRCLPGAATLPASEVGTLRRLAAGEVPSSAPSHRQASLLVDFIRYHAAEGIRLRSLDFLLAEGHR